MRGDNDVKRRGKTKQFRGKRPEYAQSDAMVLKDFSWGDGNRQPKNLIALFPIPGKWTYPAPGKIQWKKSK